MTFVKIGLGLVLLIVFFFIFKFVNLSRGELNMKSTAGQIQNGKLSPCPNKPNCVSTSGPKNHKVEPISYNETLSQERINEVIKKMGGEILSKDEKYTHAEFTSKLFRFKDDFEVINNPEDKILQVRSASRVGHSDLGVNRKRYEKFKSLILNDSF